MPLKGLIMAFNVEYFTVDAGIASSRYVTLAGAPDASSNVSFDIIGVRLRCTETLPWGLRRWGMISEWTVPGSSGITRHRRCTVWLRWVINCGSFTIGSNHLRGIYYVTSHGSLDSGSYDR